MPSFLYQGYEIFYTIEGEGSPILFLHGLGGSSQNWLYQRNYFKSMYKVFTLDFPGHGQSEGKEYLTFYDYHKLIRQLIVKELFIQETILLCGISMGGRVAIDFSYHNPNLVKGLLIADSFAGMTETEKQCHKAIHHLLLEPSGKEKWLKIVLDKMGLDSMGVIAKGFRQSILTQDSTFIYQLFGQMLDYEQRDLLPSIYQPTLVLCGEKDHFIPSSALNELVHGLKNATSIIIPNCGHLPNVEKPKIMNAYLEQFANQLNRYPSHS